VEKLESKYYPQYYESTDVLFVKAY